MRLFTEDLLDNIGIPWGDDVVYRQTIDKRRWYSVDRIVFKYDDKLWEVDYLDPATEYQEGQNCYDYHDYKLRTVACYEVEAFEKTVIDYKRVDSE